MVSTKRPENDVVLTEFDLDGVARDGKNLLVKFVASHLDFTDLVVVDLSGDSEVRIWEELVAGRSPVTAPAAPSLLLISEKLAGTVDWLDGLTLRVGHLVGYDWKSVLAG
jgi:hypothetical protein